MQRNLFGSVVLVLASVVLASCSGVTGSVCTLNCGGGGNATVSFVLTATPPSPTSQLSIQAFTANITGITLFTGSSSSVNIPLTAASYIAEFNRVTSDSTLLAAKVSVAAGSYNSVQITFASPRVTFCTQANTGVPGCTANSLASVSGPSGSATISQNFSLVGNQQTGIALNLNLGAALTTSGQTITALNLGATNAFAASSLPPASTLTDLTAGQLSHLDDIMGTVTAATSPTVTIHTTTRGDITATTNSATQFDCPASNFTCVQLNAVAIIDAVLNTDGTITLTFYEPLLPASGDLIEGVVTDIPNTITDQFTLAVTDRVFALSGSILGSQVNLGDQIKVTLSATPTPFVVVPKGLSLPVGENFSGSTSVSSIHPGQTVAILPVTFTAQSGATLGAATTSTVALRFSRITGTMSTATIPVFNATNLPVFFGSTVIRGFLTTNGRLSLDGVPDLTSIPSGNTFSATALYLDPAIAPTFAAQSVRAH
jgi:hypothetical protein